MNKEMVISSTSHETRVAILEDDQVVEVFIERERSRGVVGNIYKGRVSKVLPGMQSAFVDVDLERDAFLYVSDVISPTEESLEDEDALIAPTVESPNGGEPGDRTLGDETAAAVLPSEPAVAAADSAAKPTQPARPDRKARDRRAPGSRRT
jgi:Rne/Rng family ribonuclease